MSAHTPERDEIIARLADAYLDESDAESGLRVAASLDEDGTRASGARLKNAAKVFRAARAKMETLRAATTPAELDVFARGEGLRLAKKIENDRFRRAHPEFFADETAAETATPAAADGRTS